MDSFKGLFTKGVCIHLEHRAMVLPMICPPGQGFDEVALGNEFCDRLRTKWPKLECHVTDLTTGPPPFGKRPS